MPSHPMPEPSRLYLITPPLTEAADFAPLLEAAVEAADVACVLLRTATRDEGAVKAAFRALAPVVQGRGAAFLVGGSARLAARVDADGVHLPGVGPDLPEALDALRDRRIVGVGGLQGRDDAMMAGESGVDYLLFGGPGEAMDHEAVVERVAWWAEIFNVPCIGYAHGPGDAGAVARAGAEFVALCEGLWDEDPGAVAATLRAVAAELAAVAAA